MRLRTVIGIVFILVGGMALMLSGCSCVVGEGYRARPMGMAFQTAKSGQILNPEAGMNLTPVQEMDAASALTLNERYRKSFEEKPPTAVYNLAIGGIGLGK